MSTFRVIIGNLPDSILLLPPAKNWAPIKDLIRSLRQDGDKPYLEPQRLDIDQSGRAFVPFKDPDDAWDTYLYLQGYEWTVHGYTYILDCWLIEWDIHGRPHQIAGSDDTSAYLRYFSVKSNNRRNGSFDRGSGLVMIPNASRAQGFPRNPKPAKSRGEYQVADPYHYAGRPTTPLNSPYTPALTTTSRNSSMSSISTAFPPSNAFSYTITPKFHDLSINSSSRPSSSTALYDPSQACTSSRPLPVPEPADSLSKSATPRLHKVRIHGVKTGVTKEQFNCDVLEKKFGLYTQHAGINIKTTNKGLQVYVGFHSKDGARKVAKELNGTWFMGNKLQAQLD